MKMFKSILVGLTILFSTTVFAKNPKTCENHAYFVYQVAQTRDRGVSQTEVERAVIKVIKEHPELAITPLEEQQMKLAINIVFHSKGETPDHLANSYFQRCMSEEETNAEYPQLFSLR